MSATTTPAPRAPSPSKPCLDPTITPGSPSAPPPKKSWHASLFAYVRTPQFYLVLFLGQILSLCITSTNTFSTLLSNAGTSIPAFQSFFVYVILNAVYTPYTVYKLGWREYLRTLYRSGWKYFIFAFLDVEGNYFVVLAYRYTTVISAQLINFWAIVVVVVMSFTFLKVRYHWTQILGILICCGGMGVLLWRDAESSGGIGGGGVPDELKGDLFMLLGASLYGLSNVTEEFLVSKAPLYLVVGQIGFWGMWINGVQAAIFDRHSFQIATWNGDVIGYIVGYTLVMLIFYTFVPILLRMSSAAFFNIGLLTSNFYGVAIGIRVFGYVLDRLYPVAFVMIIVGLVVYFVFCEVHGEQAKPWLGEEQERGVAGVGTARRELLKKMERGEEQA